MQATSDKSAYEIWLIRLFILLGIMLSSAAIPMLFPISWMDQIHAWLGLGEFPDRAITAYLARSTSMLYALHGAMLLYISFHPDRCWLMFPFVGWLHFVLGFVVLGIDLTAPMPWYWTASEGVPVALAGLLIVWIWRKADQHRGREPE